MTDGDISFEEKKRVHTKILGLCSVTREGRDGHESRTQGTSASVSVKDHGGLLAKWPSVTEHVSS